MLNAFSSDNTTDNLSCLLCTSSEAPVSEERLRRVLDGMGEGFGLLAPDFTILEHNHEALRMDGRAREEIVGRSHWEVYPESENSELGHLLKKAMAERVPVSLEHLYAWEEARALWLEMRAHPIEDGSLAVFWRDITDRERAEEALRESTSRLQSIADLVPDLLWDSDPDGSTNWYNQRWLEYTGQSLEEALRWGWVDAIHPDDREVSAPRYHEAVINGEKFHQEHRIGRYDGEYYWFVVNAFMHKDKSGKVVKVYGAATDIHESRMMLEAIGKSEERTRLAVEAGELATWEWNLTTNEVFWNERHFTLFGMKPCQNPVKPEDFFKHVHPDDRERITKKLKGAIAERSLFNAEFCAVLDSGDERWVSGYGRVVETDASGEPTRVSGVMQDITERKQAEAALRNSEVRLAAIFAEAAVGLSEIGLDGRFIRVNPELCRIVGRSREELLQLSVLDVTHPDDTPQSTLALQQVMTSGQPVSLDKRYLCPDGTVVWANSSLSPLKNESGKIQPFLAVTVDLTQRLQTEASLRASEERLCFLVEGTRDYAMFLMDAQRRIFHWNTGAENLFGWSRAEAIGQSGDMIFTPEDRAKGDPDKEAEEAAREGSAPNIRWHIRKDGSRFWSDGINTGLRNEAGELLGYAKIMRDATREKEADEALQRAHAELERAHAELEQRVLERTAELQNEILQRKAVEQAREQLLHRLVNAQEEERLRISRELHDQMGQQLTALLMGLNALPEIEEVGLRPPSHSDQVQLLQSIASTLMQQMHDLAWQLRPTALDTFGLEPALQEHLQQWSKQSGVESDLLCQGMSKESRLPEAIETALYRVVQESLTNVQRHAQAQPVSVLVKCQGDAVSLLIEDDGRGFDTTQNTNRLGYWA